MTGRRFTRSVLLKKDTSTTTAAATNAINSNDDTMDVDTTNNHQQSDNNNNQRTSPHRRSSQTSENTNPILDDMSDIELDLSDIATTTSNINISNNARTVSEEQITANDEDDIDMEIGKLDDDEEQWPSPPPNNNSLSNNDTSHTMATYQQQYYGGGSADNDKLKSYRISHLQHRISTLETQVSSLSSSRSSNLPSNSNSSTTNSSTATGGVPAYQPMSQTEEEMLKRRISEMEYELQMRRNRTERLRKLIMDYVKLPSIVVDDCMPQVLNGEGFGLNEQLGMGGEMDIMPMLNMEEGEGANVVSPIVQMTVTNGEQVDGGLDSLPDLPVMNLDNVEDNGSSEGQSGKKRGYAEV